MSKLGNILGNVFGAGAEKVIGSVGAIIDDVVTTKEEREALKLEVQKEINRNLEALASQALTETELEYKEMDSARSREVELAKAGAKDKVPSVLAYLAVGGFWSIIIFLLIFGFGALSVEQALLVGGLIGTLGSNSTTVYNYYFGSSSGSRRKSEEMEELRKQLTDGKSKGGA